MLTTAILLLIVVVSLVVAATVRGVIARAEARKWRFGAAGEHAKGLPDLEMPKALDTKARVMGRSQLGY